MTPKLRVLIPSSSSGGKSKGYPPLTPCPVNSPTPTPLETEGFKGNIWVWVKGYNGDEKKGDGEEYFEVEEGGRKGMTYGIVVRGHFLKDVGGDEVVFGNVFERPIRDSLPWGTSIATKFMYFIDPVMECDIYADKPWALSPALATMSHLSLDSSAQNDDQLYIDEDSLDFIREKTKGEVPQVEGEKNEVGARRKWLGKKENRESVKLVKDVEVGMEFCNGLLDFNTLSATLPPPSTLQIPLLKYWDGQPVTYVCQRRPKDPKSNPVGTQEVFWSVAFEIVDEDARKKLEKKGKTIVRPGGGVESDDNEAEKKGEEKGDEGVSDDVD
ncbi:hypothetical protein IAR55_001965 [Kwoniella newhampshirensis]|uniref:Domain of unknown function at the cortex 1 domain-containing protein n=1 Tax=Kwoniella newhampshirensis TaxID=1651941 RepID=A0AAW0Z3K8_9TREE